MKRIYAQIEELANLYSPSVYALLPQFRDYQMEYDPASAEFKPLTAGRAPDVKNSKIFVVGILPPSVKVTGRLLDRSAQLGGDAGDAASIAAALQANPSSVPTSNVVSPAGSDCAASVLEAEAAGAKTKESSLGFLAAPGDYVDGQINAKTESYLTGQQGQTNCCNTVMAAFRKCGIQHESLEYSATSAGWWGSNNKYGGCNWTKIAQENGAWVDGSDQSQFPVRGASVLAHRYETILGIYKEFGQHAFTITSSDGSAHTKSCDGGSFYSGGGKAVVGVYASGQRWFYEDGSWRVEDTYGHRRRVRGWTNPAAMPFGETADEVPPDVEPSTDFQEQGSDAAKDAAKEQKASAGKEERGAPTAEDFLREQQRMVNATRAALDRINATPPLKLLVNPISFKPSSEKIVSDGNRSRSHHIIEHWGEQQEKIEGSGKLLGFYSQSQSGPGPGLTRTARQYSLSYQNLMSLFLIYKNNGGVWLEDFFESRSDKGAINLSVMGSIYIYYDNILYIGCFDSFNISESDAAPYTLEYNFSFTVRASFLLDRQLENSAQSYGAPGLFVGDLQTGTPDAPAGSPVQKQYTEAEMFSQHDDVVADWESEDRAEANKKKADEMFESPAPSGGNNAITPGKGSKTQSTGR